MKKRDKLTVGHRDFFGCFGAGAAASIAVGAARGGCRSRYREQRRDRYRQTEHVKTFYLADR
jgi:hypothetical protein